MRILPGYILSITISPVCLSHSLDDCLPPTQPRPSTPTLQIVASGPLVGGPAVLSTLAFPFIVPLGRLVPFFPCLSFASLPLLTRFCLSSRLALTLDRPRPTFHPLQQSGRV
ncbi:hypothetical protein F5148DRAFT_1236336, partial [Russula earlei]